MGNDSGNVIGQSKQFPESLRKRQRTIVPLIDRLNFVESSLLSSSLDQSKLLILTSYIAHNLLYVEKASKSMKLTEVTIKNCYNLSQVELDVNQGRVLIVGTNGSGKTNILKCISAVLNGPIDRRHSYSIPTNDIGKLAVLLGFTLCRDERLALMKLRIIHVIERIAYLHDRLFYHYHPGLRNVGNDFSRSREDVVQKTASKLLEIVNPELECKDAEVVIFADKDYGYSLISRIE